MFYWILLALAIVAEITGTLSMQWASVSDGNTGFILMLVMIALSYIFLSFAVKKIALGVAYALWEGIGILLYYPVQRSAVRRKPDGDENGRSGDAGCRYRAD